MTEGFFNPDPVEEPEDPVQALWRMENDARRAASQTDTGREENPGN